VRFYFYLTPNNKTVPFDYQHFLIGTFHKWMGWNKIHDEISLYSLSWLRGGKITNGGYNFPNGATWFISFWDYKIGEKLFNGIKRNPDAFMGMNIKEIIIQEEPNFSMKERFLLASPILIRRDNEAGKSFHLTFDNQESDNLMTEFLNRKLKLAGIKGKAKVYFDRNYPKAKTKLVTIKGIKNRANYCPVFVEGDPEVLKFAWNVGIGHSTGSGFGSLY